MQPLVMALWACLACVGVLMIPKVGLTQPTTQVSMRTVTDDLAHHFFDYWMMANEGYLVPETQRRLSLAQMENPLRWIRPGSEALVTPPAEVLCANADTRSLWLTCKEPNGSRRLVPFRSRCGGSPTILSLLGGRACERPSIFTVEGRPVLVERQWRQADEARAAPLPTRTATPTSPSLSEDRAGELAEAQAEVGRLQDTLRVRQRNWDAQNAAWEKSSRYQIGLLMIAVIIALILGFLVWRARERHDADVEIHRKAKRDLELANTCIATTAAKVTRLQAENKRLQEDGQLQEDSRPTIQIINQTELVDELRRRIAELEEANKRLRETPQPSVRVDPFYALAALRTEYAQLQEQHEALVQELAATDTRLKQRIQELTEQLQEAKEALAACEDRFREDELKEPGSRNAMPSPLPRAPAEGSARADVTHTMGTFPHAAVEPEAHGPDPHEDPRLHDTMPGIGKPMDVPREPIIPGAPRVPTDVEGAWDEKDDTPTSVDAQRPLPPMESLRPPEPLRSDLPVPDKVRVATRPAGPWQQTVRLPEPNKVPS